MIQLGELLEAGVKVSMSIDHTTTYNCDCFVCMRMLYALHQHRIGNRIKLTTPAPGASLPPSTARATSASPTRWARSRPASAPT